MRRVLIVATKREKKEEAKRRIAETVPNFPIPRFFPAPIRIPGQILTAAERLAQGLVEIDPLGIITDDPPAADTSNVGSRLMMAMVNDPNFVMSDEMQSMINDPDTMLVSNGSEMMKINGRNVMRRSGQFRRDKLLPRTNGKRVRTKTKTDKMMSKALAEANKRYRKKNGQLRAGRTQADVMRLAHRLRKKMS